MKRIHIILILGAVLMTAPNLLSQEYLKLLPKPAQTLYLYPEGQESEKGLEGALGPGESNGCTSAEESDMNGHISYVGDKARVDLYFPTDPVGQMVVVCPGGGYWVVSTHNEGGFVADWLLEKGISVAVVTYRLPYGHWEVPLTDVQNVMRYCRSHAEEWGITQIGVMGYSAGGHLAACASTMYTDEITRPDFSVLIYPVITFEDNVTHDGTRTSLLGHERWEGTDMKEYHALVERYSVENRVDGNTPATFLAHSTDDTTVPVENSLRYYSSLVRHGVPAEMHIYPFGGHGWSFRSEKFLGKGNDVFKYARSEFEASLERWLEEIRNR